MSYLKFAMVAFALLLFAAPSSVEAQSFQQLGTRRGAVGGAILGAIIGDQNNEAFAGAAIGGLVGGAIGNVSGRNLDQQFYGNRSYGYGGGQAYSRPVYQQPVYSRPAPTYYGGGFGPSVNVQVQRAPVYGYGGGYARPAYYGGGYGRPGCASRGW